MIKKFKTYFTFSKEVFKSQYLVYKSRFIIGMEIILNYVIPFLIIGYFPTLVIISNEYIYILLSFLSMCIVFTISLMVWKQGLKTYKSSAN